MVVWSAFGVSGNDAIQITAFRELAEEINFGQLGEGDAISVVGSLSLNVWEGKDGTERSGLKLVISKDDPVAPPAPKQRRASSPRRSQSPAPATGDYEEPFHDDPIPF